MNNVKQMKHSYARVRTSANVSTITGGDEPSLTAAAAAEEECTVPPGFGASASGSSGGPTPAAAPALAALAEELRPTALLLGLSLDDLAVVVDPAAASC